MAQTKLVSVLGERLGGALMTEVLGDLGLDAVRSAEDLHRFADALRGRGGFAAAVAGLLSLHATMYGARV